MSPFKSRAQQRWAYSEAGTKALGGPEKVKEWQSETPSKLPGHVANMKHEMAGHGLAHPPKKAEAKKHLKELHIKEAHTGGYMVHKHDGKGGMTEHVAPSLKDVKAHLMEHMGDEEQGEPSGEVESQEV